MIWRSQLTERYDRCIDCTARVSALGCTWFHEPSIWAILWDELYPDIDLETEVKLIPRRRFKFDYANIPAQVAIEINGQIWHQGGHSTGKSLMRDYEKLNLAQQHGYCVFQLSSEMITESWLSVIAETIRNRIL